MMICIIGIVFNSARNAFAQTSGTQPIISSLPGFGQNSIIILPNAAQSNTQLSSITQPDTQITAATDGLGNSISNGGSTSSTTIQFRFVAKNPPSGSSVSFLCALDPSAPTPAVIVNNQLSPANGFAACSSPITYNSIGPGQHTFYVSAVATLNGQVAVDSTPASFKWTVTGIGTLSLNGTTTLKNPPCIGKYGENIGGLPCGIWRGVFNGLPGMLIIQSVDNQGKINASLLGDALSNGSWDPISKKITFTQTINGGSNNSISYEYSGFYHNTDCLTTSSFVGSCSVLSGSAIPKGLPSEQAAKQEFGWIVFWERSIPSKPPTQQ